MTVIKTASLMSASLTAMVMDGLIHVTARVTSTAMGSQTIAKTIATTTAYRTNGRSRTGGERTVTAMES